MNSRYERAGAQKQGRFCIQTESIFPFPIVQMALLTFTGRKGNFALECI